TGITIGRPDQIERAAVELGIDQICNVYGSTETYGNCAVTPHDLPLQDRMTCQGPPLPGFELRIVDPETRRPLDSAETGEIEVRGYVTSGYIDDAVATERAFTDDGWYRTGDLGRIDERGFLSYVGRATEMIKTAGINVSPAEVERFIRSHPSVREVAVVGAPHPTKDEAPVAFVCAVRGADVDADEILGHCRRSIAGYKVPAVVIMCDELPRTATGK